MNFFVKDLLLAMKAQSINLWAELETDLLRHSHTTFGVSLSLTGIYVILFLFSAAMFGGGSTNPYDEVVGKSSIPPVSIRCVRPMSSIVMTPRQDDG